MAYINKFKIVAIAEFGHQLVLTADGSVYSKGGNVNSALGYPTDKSQTQNYKKISGLPEIQAIALGDGISAALSVIGEVYTWGRTDQIGRPKNSVYPGKIKLPEPIIELSGGKLHLLALGKSGTLYGWGWNNRGQLDPGRKNRIYTRPIILKFLPTLKKIVSTSYSNLGLDQENHLFQWGADTNEKKPLPEFEFQVISAGDTHFLALTKDKKVHSWYPWTLYSSNWARSDFAGLPKINNIKAGTDFTLTLFGKELYFWNYANFGFVKPSLIENQKVELRQLINSRTTAPLPYNLLTLNLTDISRKLMATEITL